MLYVFKIIGKKIKYSPEREGASCSLRKVNAAGNFCDKYYDQVVGLSEGHCHKAL